MKLDQRLILILALFSAMTSKLQAEPLTLQLDLGVRNVQFAGINWAQGHGWFTEAGLDLEVRSWTPEYSNVASEVANNPGTIGSIESGLFLSAIAEGKPLVAIGTMFQASPLGLISRAESNIKTPADLRGKVVAIHSDGREALFTALAHADVNPSEVTIIKAEYGNEPLLRSEMDAKQGYVVDEFVKLQTEGHAVTMIPYREYGHVAYSQVMFVSQETLKSRRSDLVTFLSVANRGWVTAAKDVPIAAQYTIDNYVPQLNFDYQNQSLKMICELVWAENKHTSAMSVETWIINAKSFRKTHPEESLPAMEQWTDFSLALEAVDGR
jgi:ABC-type nitrate/sulfonate/bicarbonate transport system substrate-binding protein